MLYASCYELESVVLLICRHLQFVFIFCLLVCLFVCFLVCLFVCLLVCLLACLLACLSVCLLQTSLYLYTSVVGMGGWLGIPFTSLGM